MIADPTAQGRGIPYRFMSTPAVVYFRSDEALLKLVQVAGPKPGGEIKPLLPLLLELAFCRAVDNYLMYVSDLLALIFKMRPKAMVASKETVPLEMVLRYDSYDDLLNAITEQKVLTLSFMGMLKLNEHMNNHWKFPLFQDSDSLNKAVTIVETRNLFVHNRGIISNRFVERVPGYAGKVGDHLTIPPDILADYFNFLQKAVLDTDHRAHLKFDIPQKQPVFGDAT
jgi:hypothetical protein